VGILLLSQGKSCNAKEDSLGVKTEIGSQPLDSFFDRPFFSAGIILDLITPQASHIEITGIRV
jgi:hypothetical protein